MIFRKYSCLHRKSFDAKLSKRTEKNSPCEEIPKERISFEAVTPGLLIPRQQQPALQMDKVASSNTQEFQTRLYP